MWLPNQFGFSEAADIEKIPVDVSDLAFKVGFRNDHLIVAHDNLVLCHR
jgi:hypothetical protein